MVPGTVSNKLITVGGTTVNKTVSTSTSVRMNTQAGDTGPICTCKRMKSREEKKTLKRMKTKQKKKRRA